jgi:hypothetical protein
VLRRVPGDDVVVVLEQHPPVGGHQHGTEGFVAGLEGGPGELDAAPQVLPISVVDHGPILRHDLGGTERRT